MPPAQLPTVVVTFGTRPEAVKMAPVIHALRRRGDLRVVVAVTGQHLELLAQVLELFDIVPDHDLAIMRAGQDLTDITSGVLQGLREVLRAEAPRMLLVHGDTTTSTAAALAGFYAEVPVAHVEAGLRTGNFAAPWPEEMNRVLTGRLASWHFAPTDTARDHLLREGVPASHIEVTGNTVIDALLQTRDRLHADPALRARTEARFAALHPTRPLILMTAHRRESFGDGIAAICDAVRRIAARGDVQLLYPVHPNPQIHEPVHRALDGVAGVHLTEPLDYLDFVALMDRCHFVLTDSGGIQEEAPALGKPVLVMRKTTERPEAIAAGTAQLVGTDADTIVAAAARLLDDPAAHAAMAHARNPFGDGRAAERIATRVAQWIAR